MAELNVQEWQTLREDISDLKSSMKDVAKALERLARLEEKHDSSRAEIERSFNEISKLDMRFINLEMRVSLVEQAMPASKKTNEWFDKGMWAILGVFGMFLAKKAGLL